MGFPIPDPITIIQFALGVFKPVLKPLFHITDEPHILVIDPFNRADPDDRKWWHVNVSTTRWRWIGSTKEAERCLVEMQIISVDRAYKITVEGMWAVDQPPYIATEVTLREGDPSRKIPIAVRSENDYRPEVQPKALVQAHRTFITDTQFLAHGYTSLSLEPGRYKVTVRIFAGMTTLATGTFWLHNPEKGVSSFVLSDNPDPPPANVLGLSGSLETKLIQYKKVVTGTGYTTDEYGTRQEDTTKLVPDNEDTRP